jgi:hypothetical protein
VANAFNKSSIIITGKLNIQQKEKGDANSLLKDSFPGNFPSLKLIHITEVQIKRTIHSPKPTKSPGNGEITNMAFKACASVVSHPFSYIYNNSL